MLSLIYAQHGLLMDCSNLCLDNIYMPLTLYGLYGFLYTSFLVAYHMYILVWVGALAYSNALEPYT